MNIRDIVNNPTLLEVGRKAVEDGLIELRDARISLRGRRNGLVVAEYDGTPSHLIRLGMENALVVALCAIERHLEEEEQLKRAIKAAKVSGDSCT